MRVRTYWSPLYVSIQFTILFQLLHITCRTRYVQPKGLVIKLWIHAWKDVGHDNVLKWALEGVRSEPPEGDIGVLGMVNWYLWRDSGWDMLYLKQITLATCPDIIRASVFLIKCHPTAGIICTLNQSLKNRRNIFHHPQFPSYKIYKIAILGAFTQLIFSQGALWRIITSKIHELDNWFCKI